MSKEPNVLTADSENSYAKVSTFKRITRTKAFPLVVLLVVMIGLFAVLSPMRNDGFQAFFRTKTIWRVIQDMTVTGFLTIGIGLLIVSGNIDLSAATCGSMAGMICAVTLSWYNFSAVGALTLAIAATLVVGVLNAVLVNELKQPPFIATMAVNTILAAICQLVATDKTGQYIGIVSFNHKAFERIAGTRIGNTDINVVAVFVVIAFILYGLALSKTKFGRTLYLMGANRNATHLAGINAKGLTYFLFINCSLLGGIAGIINASRVKAGSGMALANSQFSGMTAAILGGISFGGGSGGMGGAFAGLVVIQTFNMGMTTSGGSPYLNPILSGGLLLAALTFDFFNTRAQNKRVGA